MLLFMIDIESIYRFKQTVIYNEMKNLTVLKVHVCMLEIILLYSKYIFYTSRDYLSVSVFFDY